MKRAALAIRPTPSYLELRSGMPSVEDSARLWSEGISYPDVAGARPAAHDRHSLPPVDPARRR